MLSGPRRLSILIKLAAHADKRLRERTSHKAHVLHALRAKVHGRKLPRGTLHTRLGNDGYAVLKDLGKRHVVATVLAQHMRPPGTDVTRRVG